MFSRPQIIFIDQLAVTALPRLTCLGLYPRTVWYFERSGALSRWLLRLLTMTCLVRANVEQVPYNIGQVCTENGDSEFFNIRVSAAKLRRKIIHDQITPNHLVNSMTGEWPLDKILLHFDKSVERETDLECQRIALSIWMMHTHHDLPAERAVLLVQRGPWFRYLRDYAADRGLRWIGYRRTFHLGWASNLLLRAYRARRTRLPGIAAGIALRLFKFRSRVQPATELQENGRNVSPQNHWSPKIAIRYWYRKLGFDPSERTEFFWLPSSGLPANQILFHSYESDVPLDAETTDQLREKGITVFGRGPDVRRWVPTIQMPKLYIRFVFQIATAFCIGITKGRWVSPYYIAALNRLAWDYSYWHDFYSANGVRIDVGTIFSRVGQILALDALNGISLGYQVSISTIIAPSTELNAGEDVHVIYAPAYEEMWSAVESPVSNFVHAGLLQCKEESQTNPSHSTRVRKDLEDSGAQFIICFLDENSNDSWTSTISHQRATADYEFLLNWMLEDSTLGLVFKPKKSNTLFDRIKSVSGLLEIAKQTGRCTFLTSDYVNSAIFPAQAANAADLCIGKLGGTAPLEAQLAGVKTLLIDGEGFGGHPFYAWCRNRIAYRQWSSLRAAVETYRADPTSDSKFGDWSPDLKNLDSFLDNQGGLRMGAYIGWIHEGLSRGEDKEVVLHQANRKYSETWGYSSEATIPTARS